MSVMGTSLLLDHGYGITQSCHPFVASFFWDVDVRTGSLRQLAYQTRRRLWMHQTWGVPSSLNREQHTCKISYVHDTSSLSDSKQTPAPVHNLHFRGCIGSSGMGLMSCRTHCKIPNALDLTGRHPYHRHCELFYLPALHVYTCLTAFHHQGPHLIETPAARPLELCSIWNPNEFRSHLGY
jgi:hypothetical protein